VASFLVHPVSLPDVVSLFTKGRSTDIMRTPYSNILVYGLGLNIFKYFSNRLLFVWIWSVWSLSAFYDTLNFPLRNAKTT